MGRTIDTPSTHSPWEAERDRVDARLRAAELAAAQSRAKAAEVRQRAASASQRAAEAIARLKQREPSHG